MSPRKRLLRIAATVLAVVLFAGWFAFSTFLFSPIEGDYEGDVSHLIPRGVDFFVAKARLAADFESFPGRLAVADELEATEGGRQLLASPELARWKQELGWEQLLADVEANLAQLPVEVDLLDVLAGRDLAIAGYWHGTNAADAAWAVYGRTNWMGKLAVALLAHPGLLGLAEQGLVVTQQEDVISLTGGQLVRPLYLTRIRDVVVIGTDAELVQAAPRLRAQQSQDSFGLSARYDDHVDRPDRRGDELEMFVDLRAIQRELGWRGDWPDRGSQDLAPALLGRLFQMRLLNELVGTLGFHGGLSLDVHGELSSEEVSAFQKRLYRDSRIDSTRVVTEMAAIAPRDTALFACLSGSAGDLLRQLRESFEPSTRNLVDDLARGVWGWSDAEPLIAQLDACFKDDFVFVVRTNDYPDEGEAGPPHDDQTVFAWALVAWLDEPAKLDELRDKVITNQVQFGIQGRPGSNEGGVFRNEVLGGYRVYEYWSPFIAGTGHLASVTASDLFVLSNNHQMLGHMLKTYFQGEEAGARYARLSDSAAFAVRVRDALPTVSALVWVDPRAAAPTLREMARQWAEDDVVIDWSVERPRLEKKVLKEQFGGRARASMGEQEQQELDLRVDREAERFEQEYRSQHAPARHALYERNITYAELLSGALVELALFPKKLELAVRAGFALEP